MIREDPIILEETQTLLEFSSPQILSTERGSSAPSCNNTLTMHTEESEERK